MTKPASDPCFERDVREAFAFIAGPTGPRLLLSEYSPESFGNAIVVLEGDALRVRVKRDRSQLLVDLAPRGRSEWFDEHVVLQLVGATEAAQALAAGEWRALAPSAEAIHAHFSTIVARFQSDAWSQTRSDLKSLQERRARELFSWPRPGDSDRAT